MSERVLDPAALNRALLARQLLLERAPVPPARALELLCGLQTQHAPSGYVGLWTRTAGLRRADLTDALRRGTVVQGWVMRSTIHMVAAGDYAPFTAAVRAARRAQWLRTDRRAARLDLPALGDAVRRHLADGPLPRARLVALLEADGFPRSAWAGAQLWADLLRVPPAGTWDRPGANLFALAERVLGPLPEVPEGAARDLLVARYLRAFGPASAADTALFTGLPPAEVRDVLARLELRWFRDEAGRPLADVPDGPLPPPDTPAPVRFLPTWDAALLVHARRTGILPEPYRPRVFATAMPRSVGTFLVDGRVAGTWRPDGHRIVTEPFHELPAGDRRELAAEAERLAAFHGTGV